jgi:hypothetical protein
MRLCVMPTGGVLETRTTWGKTTKKQTLRGRHRNATPKLSNKPGFSKCAVPNAPDFSVNSVFENVNNSKSHTVGYGFNPRNRKFSVRICVDSLLQSMLLLKNTF